MSKSVKSLTKRIRQCHMTPILRSVVERLDDLRRNFRNPDTSQGERARSWTAYCQVVDDNWTAILEALKEEERE